jgi:proteic killer suppression protein
MMPLDVTNAARYYPRVIQGFACEETKKIYDGKVSRRLPQNLLNVMQRKLRMLDAAHQLIDLRVPPNNQLEALKADRKGQHSIRVNKQWRVCFCWTASGPADVEVVDYH